MADISVVLVGYGAGGRVFHAPFIGATPGLRLAAIVTSDPERARQAHSQWPSASIESDVDRALAAGHDLAVITTPNATHVPLALKALQAGVHVVLDKPIAPDAAAAEDLAQAAQDAGRLLVPYQNRRWDSDLLTALAVARSGRLGTVHRFDSRIDRFRVSPKAGWKGSADPELMGGLLYDLGPHLIDQALMLMGPVVRVTASARTVRRDELADDDVTIMLEHASGALSVLGASQAAAFAEPRMVLTGTSGALRIDAADSQEAHLLAADSPADPDWGLEPASHAARLRTWVDTQLVEEAVPLERGSWTAFYSGLVASIRDGAPPPVAISDVISSVRVLDAARASAQTNRTVEVVPMAGHTELRG